MRYLDIFILRYIYLKYISVEKQKNCLYKMPNQTLRRKFVKGCPWTSLKGAPGTVVATMAQTRKHTCLVFIAAIQYELYWIRKTFPYKQWIGLDSDTMSVTAHT